MTDGGARRRNVRGQGARLREELVEAATRIVERTGRDDAVTLRAVARETGVSPQSIYPHFSGPVDILSEVLNRALLAFATTLREAGAAVEPARERLVVRSLAFLDFARDRPQRYNLLFKRTPGAASGSLFAPESSVLRQCELAFGAFADVVREAQIQGGGSGATAAEDASMLWAGLHGYVVLRRSNPIIPWPSDDRTAVELLVSRICRL